MSSSAKADAPVVAGASLLNVALELYWMPAIAGMPP